MSLATGEPFIIGDNGYIAFPDGLERVTIIGIGYCDKNTKYKMFDPVLVRNRDNGDEYLVEKTLVYTDMLAACCASAELAKEIDND